MSWRLLTGSNVPHDRGLALDDALTRLAPGETHPTLRLYTYSPCVLVGRFQRVSYEVNLEHCAALGVPINRRPSGGGAIIMGPDQLGIALVIPNNSESFPVRSSDLMKRSASGLLNALGKLDIPATFEGKNDLVTRSKKIAGLGLYQPNNGGRLFHASVLLDLDISQMLKLLNTPYELSRNLVESSVVKRITTIRAEVDPAFELDELIETVKAGYEDEFGTKIEAAPIRQSEKDLADELFTTQYSNHDWIFGSSTPVHDRIGRSYLRTEAGHLEVKVIVAGEIIKSVYLGGNFIASDNAVYDLESRLRWHSSHPAAIRKTVADSIMRNKVSWDRISVDQVTGALLKALNESRNEGSESVAGACFIRKEAGATQNSAEFV